MTEKKDKFAMKAINRYCQRCLKRMGEAIGEKITDCGVKDCSLYPITHRKDKND